MKSYILGNWKMNLLREEARALARSLCEIDFPRHVEVAVFPPFTSLSVTGGALQGCRIALGAQDCSEQSAHGAFTGDVSAAMLNDAGCRYVILGHSERRLYQQESNERVRRKAEAALAASLIPVICVGETQQDRTEGRHLEAVERQLRRSLPSLTHSNHFIIAYEPVWAIGSGATPTLAQIGEMHKTIASVLTYDTSGTRTSIVYGGSVKSSNAAEILAEDTVDGVLVGGASLKAEEFGAIIAGVKKG